MHRARRAAGRVRAPLPGQPAVFVGGPGGRREHGFAAQRPGHPGPPGHLFFSIRGFCHFSLSGPRQGRARA
eukprot:10152068-Lingulodinium_polyedra.AAC.1